MVKSLRWTARAFVVGVSVYFLAYLIRGGVQSPSLLTTGESFAVLGIVLGMGGLLVVWMREGAGAGLMLAGYVLIAVSFRELLSVRMLHVMGFSGLLCLAAWWLGERTGSPARPVVLPAILTTWIVRWQKPLASAGLVVIVLFLNEVFLTPPLMSPALRSDPGVTGRWEGRSAIMSGWVQQHRLKIAVTIDSIGIVSGGVGDAVLAAGMIAPNRSWFGGLLGWRSEFMISGVLKGMLVAPESIARAEVWIPLNFRSGRLVGCLRAIGGEADSRGDVECDRLSIFRPGPDRSVTFRVRPETIPEASRVYLTGDHDQLGNWEPAGAALDRQSDGTWTRTFRFPAGSVLSFNCTRGSWRTQALNATGGALPNRLLEVRRDTTVDLRVVSWADIIM